MSTTICRIAIGLLVLAASAAHVDDYLVDSNGALFAAELSQDLLRKVEEDPHVVACRKNREAVAGNPYRPLYHMSAPDKLIHDPNGLCQWKGQYHLFYQYKMPGPGRLIHWGHAYSDDLLHWKDLPVAIKPTIEGSCFSGTTLVEKDRVIAMYHGTGRGNMIATASDPLLLDWKKHPNNPVIPRGNTQGPYAVYDPCIWKEKDGYYYTLTRGHKPREIHILRSQDLTDWKWLGPMFTDEKFAGPGEDISCPYFWPIGNGKHLLLSFSHGRAGQGYLGTFDLKTARFKADYHFRANYGPWMHGSIHAPSATVDDKGRYVAIYNMKEGIGVKHEGWDGVMSLPMVYSLAKDNSLMVHPVEEIEKLRFGHKELAARPISSNKEEVLQGIGGKAVEIKAVLKPGTAKEVGLKVLQSPDGGEYTVIRFSADNKLSIDTSHSSQLQNLKPRSPETGPLVLEKGEPLELRIFIDRSIVEVFANGRLFLGVRVYPTKEDASGVSLFSTGGDAELVSLQAWQMRSVWPELKGKEAAGAVLSDTGATVLCNANPRQKIGSTDDLGDIRNGRYVLNAELPPWSARVALFRPGALKSEKPELPPSRLPLRNGNWGGATQRGNKVWIHVFEWPGEQLNLPALKETVKSARVLTGGEAKVANTPGQSLLITLPKAQQDAVDTIIELTLERP